ncbi:hypothetical protein KCU90_g157, partial [Aureobasidium melanogenum]
MGSRVWLRRRKVLRSGFGDLMAGGGDVSLRSNSSTSEVVGGIGVKSSVSGDCALLTLTAERAAAMVADRLDVEALVLCGGLFGSLR